MNLLGFYISPEWIVAIVIFFVLVNAFFVALVRVGSRFDDDERAHDYLQSVRSQSKHFDDEST